LILRNIEYPESITHLK